MAVPDPNCAITTALLQETEEGVMVADLTGAVRYLNGVAAGLLAGPEYGVEHLREGAGVNLQKRLMNEDLAAGDPDALAAPPRASGISRCASRSQGENGCCESGPAGCRRREGP